MKCPELLGVPDDERPSHLSIDPIGHHQHVRVAVQREIRGQLTVRAHEVELETWLESLGETDEQSAHPIDADHGKSSCSMVGSAIGQVDDVNQAAGLTMLAWSAVENRSQLSCTTSSASSGVPRILYAMERRRGRSVWTYSTSYSSDIVTPAILTPPDVDQLSSG